MEKEVKVGVGVRVIYNGFALTQYLTCDYDREKNVFSDHAPIYYPDLDLIVWNVCFMGKLIGIKVKKDTEDEKDIDEYTIKIPNNKFRGVILEDDKDYHIRLKHISSVINNIDVSCWLIQEMFANDLVNNSFFKIDKRYDTEINYNRPAQSIIVKREDLTETVLENPHIQKLKNDIIIYDKTMKKAYNNVNKIGYMYRIIEKTKKIYFSIHVRYGTIAEEISKMFTDLLNIISPIFRDYIVIFGGDYNMDIIANNIKDKFLYISDAKNKDNSYTTTIYTTYDNYAYAYADNNCKFNDTNIDFCVVYSPLSSEELSKEPSKEPSEQPSEQPHIINTPHHTILELPLYNKKNIVSKEKVNSFFANYEKINNRKYNKQTDYTNILYNDEFIGGVIEEKLEKKSDKPQTNPTKTTQQTPPQPLPTHQQPSQSQQPTPQPKNEEKKEPDNINTILSSIFGIMVVIIVIVLLASQSKKSSKKNKHKI